MLTFTAGELIERAKQRLRRASSDFCTPAEYRSLCDVAWRRCYNRTARKFPSYYSADATINIVAGTASYPLPTSPRFRSMQNVGIRNTSTTGVRPVRPLTELMLEGVTAPETGATALLRYVPEATRIPTNDAGDAVSIELAVAADEWIVNCICRMVITKEGTDRSAYDQDFAMLDAELETYCGDLDLGWPNEVNETFPAYGYGFNSALVTNLLAGYIIRGNNIEFWSYRTPGL